VRPRGPGRRRWPGALVGVLGLAGLALRPAAGTAGLPIEARYAADRPTAVRHEVAHDRAGAPFYEVFAPEDLGPPGTLHAVITWGNGSFAHPSDYAPFLPHLATWGFVVVAAETDQSGSGEEILAATRDLLARQTNPRSRFRGHLDLAHVGAGGHSQGAGGVVRATVASHGLIRAVLLEDLPNPLFTFDARHAYDTRVAQLEVPTLFVAGAQDVVISDAATNVAFYDAVPGPAALALRRGADHNTVQHAAPGYAGALTAWFRYLLAGDTTAALVFTGPHPELLANPGFVAQRTKALPGPPVP
jgi:pimeloyl-ACP methyl ester carboxylesterase